MPINHLKKTRILKRIVSLLTVVLIGAAIANAMPVKQETSTDTYSPHTNNGERWRVAYVLMDESSVYVNTFDNLIRGLITSGWLDVSQEALKNYPSSKLEETQTIDLWYWLKNQNSSSYINFVFSEYPNGLTTEAELEKFVNKVNKRLQEEKIDLVIIMGDEAASRFKRVGCKTKMMVLGTSDPVKLNIVGGSKNSNQVNIWAHVDNDKYIRQIEMFYNTFQFKRLAVIYDKNAKNKIKNAAEIEAIRKVAQEFGFKVQYQNLAGKDAPDFDKRAKAVCQELAKDIDAVYILNYKNVDEKEYREILDVFYKKHIYTFAETAGDVYKGALMSATTLRDEGMSQFLTEIFCRLLDTDYVGDIKQQYVATPQMIINLKTAEKSGIDIDYGQIMAADQVLQK